MLPLSDSDITTGHADDLSTIGYAPKLTPLATSMASWDLSNWPDVASPAVEAGAIWEVRAGDVVTSAPDLARLTLNLAHVHHDRFSQSSGRLVYGGHTIGLAHAQLTKTLPQILTVGGWHGCDHTGPVREGDTLTSRIEVMAVSHVSGDLRTADLRVLVRARDERGDRDVLDWEPIVFLR
jgi:acyl dehydratase